MLSVHLAECSTICEVEPLPKVVDFFVNCVFRLLTVDGEVTHLEAVHINF